VLGDSLAPAAAHLSAACDLPVPGGIVVCDEVVEAVVHEVPRCLAFVQLAGILEGSLQGENWRGIEGREETRHCNHEVNSKIELLSQKKLNSLSQTEQFL